MSDERSVTEFTPAELLNGLARIYSGLRERNAHLEYENRRLKALVGKLESEHARLVSARVGSENEFNAIVEAWWKDEHLRRGAEGLPEPTRCDGEMHHDVLFWNPERTHLNRMLCLWCGRVREMTEDEKFSAEKAFAEEMRRDEERQKALLARLQREGGGCPTSGG